MSRAISDQKCLELSSDLLFDVGHFQSLYFGHEACGILAPWPGIEPTPLELEGEILTIEPTEKSHKLLFSYPIYSIYDQQAKGLICITVLLLNLYHFLAAFESKLNLTWIWRSITMCISFAYQ